MTVSSFILASSTASSTTSSDEAAKSKRQRQVKHPRRYCRADGCCRIVKSQGLCQRHGAKTRFCKVTGCTKQAQGSFNGMCKAHFNEYGEAATSTADLSAGTGEHSSVYEKIIPDSVNWNPAASPLPVPPLVQYLQNGNKRPAGWHRNDERIKRGLQPTPQEFSFDDWEQDLAFTEAVICSGRADTAQSLSHLAHAWGRRTDFHISLSLVCLRHQRRLAPPALSSGPRLKPIFPSSPQESRINPEQSSFSTTKVQERAPSFERSGGGTAGDDPHATQGGESSSPPLLQWPCDSSAGGGEFEHLLMEPFGGFASV